MERFKEEFFPKGGHRNSSSDLIQIQIHIQIQIQIHTRNTKYKYKYFVHIFICDASACADADDAVNAAAKTTSRVTTHLYPSNVLT